MVADMFLGRVEWVPASVYEWLKSLYGGKDLPLTEDGDLRICSTCIDLAALKQRREEEQVRSVKIVPYDSCDDSTVTGGD